MALATIRTPEERIEKSVMVNTKADLEGNVTLEPSNYYLNWWWNQKDDFGDPLGWKVVSPPVEDGHNLHLTEPNKGVATMACQPYDPIPPHQPSWVATEAWRPGHSPPTKLMGDRSGMAPPYLAPVITKLPVSQSGYKAGTYPLSYYYKDAAGQMSTLAPLLFATVPQGGRFRVYLDMPIPEGVAVVGLVLGTAGGGASTCRPQKEFLTSNMPEYYDLSGPYRATPLPPSNNQTYIGTPPAPLVGLTDALLALQRGLYEVFVTLFTIFGESLPSPGVVIDNTDGAKAATGIEVIPQGVDQNTTGYKVYVTKDGQSYAHSNTTHSFSNTSKNEVTPGQNYRKETRRTIVNGKVVEDVSTEEGVLLNSVNRSYSGAITIINGKEASGEKMTPQQTPREDNSGAPTPNAALGQVTVLPSLAPLAPGSYVCGWTKTRGEDETQLGPTASFTLNETFPGSGVASEIAQIAYSHPINAIHNAQFTELDSASLPLSHTSVKGSGDIRPAEGGGLEITTLGSKSTTDTPVHYSNVIPIDRSSNYIAQAAINASVASGAFEAVLHEYDVPNPTPATTPIRSTVLKNIASSGATSYSRQFGPDSTPFNVNTISSMIQHRVTGAVRNAVAQISSWKFSDFNVQGRTHSVVNNVYNPNPPPATPFPTYPFKIIAAPPQATKPRWVGGAPYLEILKFLGVGATPDPMPAGWAASRQTTGTVSQIEAGARIEGDFGYRLQKTATTDAFNCVWKNFDNAGRISLSERWLVRIDQMPNRNGMALMAINGSTSAPTASRGMSGDLANVTMDVDGTINLNSIYSQVAVVMQTVAATVKAAQGDVLDIELIVRDAGKASAHAVLLVGKNGSTRVEVARVAGSFWYAFRPYQAVFGPYTLKDPATQYNLATDTWIVADNGAPLVLDPPSPPMEPLKRPDRPRNAPTYLATRGFEGGNASSGTLTRTPADATTTCAVLPAAAIDGRYGLRVSDTGTTSAADLYYAEVLSQTRTTLGIEFKMRVVGRPSSGQTRIASIRSQSGATLARVEFNSNGNLYLQPLHAVGSATPQLTQIASNITNGEVVSIELVLFGAGTAQGGISALVTRSGVKELYADVDLLDWTGHQIAEYRIGGYAATELATTFTLDLDTIDLTERGKYIYSEFTEAGETIEQAYLLLYPGQPKSFGLFLNGGTQAVEPGKTYTAAIKTRWSGIPAGQIARPFNIIAYDRDGGRHDLGSVIGPNGAIGTVDWQDYWISVTIPPDCFYIVWESRDMIQGEYVAQEPFFGRGVYTSSPSREVVYPLTGSYRVMIDTGQEERNMWSDTLDRIWRKVSARTTDAPGCTATASYYSSETPEGLGSAETTDPTLVPQARYLHSRVAFTSNGKDSSKLHSGSPRVDYKVIGLEDTLLTLDEQELPGGVVLGDVQEWIPRERVDVTELESGRITRQRSGDPVGYLQGGFSIECFTLETKRIIEQRWATDEWIIETPTEKVRIMPSAEIELKRREWTRTINGQQVTGFWEGTSEYCEVVEAVPVEAVA